MSAGPYRFVIDGDDPGQAMIVDLRRDGERFDVGCFLDAQEVPPTTITGTLTPGAVRDVVWTEHMLPAVDDRTRAIVDDVAPGAVQWVPLALDGQPPRYIMNVLYVFDCVDHERSRGLKYPTGERAGQWLSFIHLQLRDDVVPEHPIFRVEGSRGILLVTEPFRAAFEREEVTGGRWMLASLSEDYEQQRRRSRRA